MSDHTQIPGTTSAGQHMPGQHMPGQQMWRAAMQWGAVETLFASNPSPNSARAEQNEASAEQRYQVAIWLISLEIRGLLGLFRESHAAEGWTVGQAIAMVRDQLRRALKEALQSSLTSAARTDAARTDAAERQQLLDERLEVIEALARVLDRESTGSSDFDPDLFTPEAPSERALQLWVDGRESDLAAYTALSVASLSPAARAQIESQLRIYESVAHETRLLVNTDADTIATDTNAGNVEQVRADAEIIPFPIRTKPPAPKPSPAPQETTLPAAKTADAVRGIVRWAADSDTHKNLGRVRDPNQGVTLGQMLNVNGREIAEVVAFPDGAIAVYAEGEVQLRRASVVEAPTFSTSGYVEFTLRDRTQSDVARPGGTLPGGTLLVGVAHDGVSVWQAFSTQK